MINCLLGHSVFSPSQLNALKYQIMAYKLLSKDAPLPLNLQQAVLAPLDTIESSPSTPITTQSLPYTNKRKPSQPTTALNTNIPKYNAYVAPSNLLVKPITSYAHASRQQRLLVPSLIPVGLDTQRILSARSSRLQSRIQYHLDHHHPNTTKDIIQAKALKLWNKQTKVH
jgi:ATP-dependent helicase STH1/SNF2